MVLLDIRREAVGDRVDEDRLQAAPALEAEDALLESVGSGDPKKTAGVQTGYWSYSLPSPGVRYYAFYGPPKPKSAGIPALPKAAPRYGVGGGLPR